MTIGEKILLLRKRYKISQETLAELIGYETKGAISLIESGKRDVPIDKVIPLANALHCTPAYLMGWEDENGNNYTKLERLYSAIGVEDLSEEEENMIIDYARYLISRRKG